MCAGANFNSISCCDSDLMKRTASFMVLSLAMLSVCYLVAVCPCFGDEWIVEVVSVETGLMESGTWVPKVRFWKGETIFVRATVINRASISKDAKITATIYDDIDQPIGYDDEKITLPPETTQTINLSIRIPSWTATGEAVAYVNALQVIEGIPFCLPYCPETSVSLEIYDTGGGHSPLPMPA